jgi:hypothetical protein
VQTPQPSLSEPPIDVLVIGDSISCGYVSGVSTGAISCSRGYLDTFPSVTQRLLNAFGTTPTVSITAVAYPGITFANPLAEGDPAYHSPRGMVDRSFHVSSIRFLGPWLFLQSLHSRCRPGIHLLGRLMDIPPRLLRQLAILNGRNK